MARQAPNLASDPIRLSADETASELASEAITAASATGIGLETTHGASGTGPLKTPSGPCCTAPEPEADDTSYSAAPHRSANPAATGSESGSVLLDSADGATAATPQSADPLACSGSGRSGRDSEPQVAPARSDSDGPCESGAHHPEVASCAASPAEPAREDYAPDGLAQASAEPHGHTSTSPHPSHLQAPSSSSEHLAPPPAEAIELSGTNAGARARQAAPQQPAGLAHILDRETWLRSEVHDPLGVLRGQVQAGVASRGAGMLGAGPVSGCRPPGGTVVAFKRVQPAAAVGAAPAKLGSSGRRVAKCCACAVPRERADRRAPPPPPPLPPKPACLRQPRSCRRRGGAERPPVLPAARPPPEVQVDVASRFDSALGFLDGLYDAESNVLYV